MKLLGFRLSRSQVLSVLAYGLFLTCTSIMLWGGYAPFVQGAFSSADALVVDYFARGTSFSASLLIAAFFAYRNPRAQRWRSPWVALGLFAIGGLVLFAQGLMESPFPTAPLTIGICFGLGSGLVFCLLQQIIAGLKVYEAGIVVFAAAGLSAAAFFIIELPLAASIPWLSFLCLLPMTFLALIAAQKTGSLSHPMFETVPQQRRDRCREALVELWRPLICIAFSAFIIGLIRIETISSSDFLRQVNMSNMIGLLIASVILLASWRFVYENIGLARLYLVLFPLTATAFLLLPLFEGSLRDVFISFELVVFSITSSFMVISCARTARNQCLHPVLVYGLFAGIVYGFSVLGSLIWFLLAHMQVESFIPLLVIALGAIYALSLVMAMQRWHNKESLSAQKNPPYTSAPAQHDSTEGKCVIISERYDLSKRESDVLLLLAKGRDAPFIATEFVISKNTVRSHIKSIFSKTGVHSRQELIDLVEQTEF